MRHDFEEKHTASVGKFEHEPKELRVQSGEGYYQALHRFMPELSNRELVKLSAEVRKYNHGKDVLKAGESLQLPPMEIGENKKASVAKHDAKVSAHKSKDANNEDCARKVIVIEPAREFVHKVAPPKNPTDARNEALLNLLGTATTAVKDKIEEHTIKPLAQSGKDVKEHVDGAVKSAGEAISKSVEQTGKWAKKTGDDAVKTAASIEKTAEEKAGQIYHSIAEQLKPDEKTVAALKKFEEAQRRVDQERELRNQKHLIDGTISIAKALHNVQRTISECGNFFTTITNAAKDNIRI